ncbi:uncharacterized protein TNCV_4025241 [Trichonephila clavipes]|uniref:Uncharacterized protein n=1 Tax=Trichonephila clavipes TaxID=2585209 RepID=A0A8X6WDM6_TRICX|nr:uncharacterized protein TNCV_4025241 [Trichonephila clavipes]
MKILIQYSTTHLCEMSFSSVAAIKTPYQSQLEINAVLHLTVAALDPKLHNLISRQKVRIPDNYIGVVLKENKNLSISDDKRDLKKGATFKEFTSWNWDIVPSPQDKLVKALQWINLTSVLHKPVTEYANDIKESSKSQVKRKFNQIDNS